MKVTRIFIMLLFCACLGGSSVFSGIVQDCDKIEVKIDTENATSGLSNGKVTVNFLKGNKRTAKFIFCDAKGKVLNEEQFEKESLDGLGKGTYYCIVSTSDCSKKVSFTID